MRELKLHRLIEFLKSVEFYHDTFDIAENGIREILYEYGIYDFLTKEELEVLRKELHDVAEQNEFREAVVLATKENDGITEMF